MRILIANDKFKGSLSAAAAGEAIAAGVRAARKDAVVECVPMADGGEGTLDVLLAARNGQRREIEVSGPLGERLKASVGLLDGASTAVVELAQAAGLMLIPADRRDPLITSTYGVGELIRAALDAGVERVVLTVGGSATVDGGAGMMQALGARLMDRSGRELPAGIGGGRLKDVARLGLDTLHPALLETRITIAVDVLNPLCGPSGAAAIFARQKGADERGVATLEQGLSHWADLLEQIGGRDFRNEPGAGAAGGVAAPLLAIADADIAPGIDLVIDATGLRERMSGVDLVITGEGRLDAQSMMGKTVGGVARLARAAGVRCVAVVGSLGAGHEVCDAWLDQVVSLADLAGDTHAAKTDVEKWLAIVGEKLVDAV